MVYTVVAFMVGLFIGLFVGGTMGNVKRAELQQEILTLKLERQHANAVRLFPGGLRG